MLKKIANKYLEKIADGSTLYNSPEQQLMTNMILYNQGPYGVPYNPTGSTGFTQVVGGIGDTLLSFVDSMVKPAGNMGWKAVNRVLANHYATKTPKRIKETRDAINAADPVVTQYMPKVYKSLIDPDKRYPYTPPHIMYNNKYIYTPYRDSHDSNYVDLRNTLDMDTILDYNDVDNMLNKDAETWYKATLPTNQVDSWIREGANFAATVGLYSALFNTHIAPALASRLGIAGKIAGTAFDWLGPDYAWEIGTKAAAKPSDDFRNWAIQKYKAK